MRPGARYAHESDFNLVADCFTARDLPQLLGVSQATLKRWRCGKARIPWAAYQLLYERSPYGIAERDSAEQFNRYLIVAEREALRERVRYLERELDRQARAANWQCANDPYISVAL